MKKCSNECIPVCDFCKFYKDYSILNKNENEEFEGIGMCICKNKEVSASDCCYTNFHCFNVKTKNKKIKE